MENSDFANDVEHILMAPFYLDIAIAAFHLVAMVVVFIGVVILFFNSVRPGRIMMLFGMVFSALTTLPLLFYSEGIDGSVSIIDKLSIWYLPMADSFFVLLGSVGFLMFTLSFRKKMILRRHLNQQPD